MNSEIVESFAQMVKEKGIDRDVLGGRGSAERSTHVPGSIHRDRPEVLIGVRRGQYAGLHQRHRGGHVRSV